MSLALLVLLLVLVLVLTLVTAAQSFDVGHLRINGRMSPAINVPIQDDGRVGYSWAILSSSGSNERAVVQQAYRLTLYTRWQSVDQRVLVHDSGWIAGNSSIVTMRHRTSSGASALKGNKDYVVVVSVRVASHVIQTEGLFHTTVAPKISGAWIGSKAINMNQLRKEFSLPSGKPVFAAYAYVATGGIHELWVNDQPADPTLKLEPGWTTYEKTLLYNAYNVTAQVVAGGRNCIGLNLGGGWFSQSQWVAPSRPEPAYGPPFVVMFELIIEFTDGSSVSVSSDTSWKGRQGPITHESLYGGETFDARLERRGWSRAGFVDNTSLWINASVLPSPAGQLVPEIAEPVRVLKFIMPVAINAPDLNKYVVDFGQNFAGWARFNFTGPAGVAIRMQYAEILEQQSSGIYSDEIYRDNLRSANQEDVYILRGDPNGETYEPRFTYHGFRYVAIVGTTRAVYPQDVIGVHVGSSVAPIQTFNSTNPTLQRINSNIVWGQISNLMTTGVPSDCPQRDERKGWMGDAALTCDEAASNFHMNNFYSLFLNNIRDTQDATGAVPDTVPWSFGGIPADPNWGTAYPTVLYTVYEHYGNTAALVDHYSNVKAWVDMLTSQYQQTGLSQLYYHYGDWVPPPPHQKTNPHLVSSYAYLNDVQTMIKIARVLGNAGDEEKYTSLYNQLTTQFHKDFYNPDVGGYADGQQTANVLALALPGVVPQSVKAVVINSLLTDVVKNQNNHLTTGIIGTKCLFEVLSNVANRTDVALDVATQLTYPSFGYMFSNPFENATTLWELWDAPYEGPGMNSRNHIMFGSIGSWFYKTLAGINLNGLQNIRIAPKITLSPHLPSLQVTRQTLLGLLAVEWQVFAQQHADDNFNSNSNNDNDNNNAVQHVTIVVKTTLPHNAKYELVLPKIAEGSHYVSVYETLSSSLVYDHNHAAGSNFLVAVEGIESVRSLTDGELQVSLGSGTYHFIAEASIPMSSVVINYFPSS